MVVCKVNQCPYCENGVCTVLVPAIEEDGHCSYIFHRGMLRNEPVPALTKKDIILDAEEVELDIS